MTESDGQDPPVPVPSYTDHRLSGHELVITPEMTSKVVWALRRYTSLVYSRRMFEMYRAFIGGVEEWANTLTSGEKVAFAREILGRFYGYQGELESGLDDIARGWKRTGYQQLREGLVAFEYMNGRRFDDGIFWEFAGWRSWYAPAVGLFSWAERASGMATRIRDTLGARWTYEKLLGLKSHNPLAERYFPESLPSPPRLLSTPVVKTASRVPFTGIYLPTSFPGGCPNHLVEGWRAPQATRTHIRRETAAFVNHEGQLEAPSWELYEEEVDATWQPMWRDDRYGPRPPADPPEFLNEDTNFPPFPPHYTPPV